MFAQLGVIAKTRNNFAEITAVAGCYLIITHEKRIKEVAVPNVPSYNDMLLEEDQ